MRYKIKLTRKPVISIAPFRKRWKEAIKVQVNKFEYRLRRNVTDKFTPANQPAYTKEYFFDGNSRLPNTSSGDMAGVLWIQGDVFSYLELGTRVRYVKMTPGYVPLTIRRKLKTQMKQGGPSHFVDKPLPGIKPRGWREVLLQQEALKFQRLVNRKTAQAISEAIKST